MSPLLRTLLVCLLALALPVQATLAATRAFCAAHAHGNAATHSTVGTTAGLAAPHEACAQHTASPAGPAPAGGQQADAVPAADTSCSACAACCMPGSMPPRAPGPAAADPAPTVFEAVDAAVEAFASGGPDRPPRSALG